MEESKLNPLWRIWEYTTPLKIRNTGYTLIGYSIAALRTNFYIKELDIMLDAGISGNMSPDSIFITHCHSDHTANLPFHLYTQKNTQIQVYVPEESIENFKKYVESTFMLTYDASSLDESTTYKFNPVSITDKTLSHGKGKTTINVEVFKCFHTVPCVGYGFSENRQKLKEEYKQLPGKEIAKLRADGIDIYNIVTNYFLIFLGDTSKEILEDKELLKYSTIMIECTFLLDEELANADKTKHMHWNYLKPFVLSHPEITFILYHFSQRYKGNEIKEFFDKENCPNIITWISHG